MRILLPSLLSLAAASLPAQALELRSGEILAGRVTAVRADSLTMTTGYPTVQERTVARADVEPRSWLALLQARSDANDAKAHLVLAATAEDLALPGHAIVELQQALQLDASLRGEVERRIAALRTQVAADLLTMAKDALAAERFGEAKLTAQVLTEKYADTPAAAGAKELYAAALQHLRTSAPPVAGRTDAKAVAAAKELEDKADKLAPATAGGIGPTVKETRQREQSVKLLEKAMSTLAPLAGDDAAAARDRVRGKLRDQYLALATNLLQRRSLDRATEWNGMACALDPEHGGCHRLQDLIVQARLTYGY